MRTVFNGRRVSKFASGAAILAVATSCGEQKQESKVEAIPTSLSEIRDQLSAEAQAKIKTLLKSQSVTKIRKAACYASGGMVLKDLDGLRVALNADPVKYYPGASRFVGTPLEVSYTFFRQGDNSLVGQAYVAPQLKATPLATMSKNPVDVSLGFTYGCGGDPSRLSGYQAGFSVGGGHVQLGVDASAAFERMMLSNDVDSAPQDFASVMKLYFQANQKIRDAVYYVERKRNSAPANRENYSFEAFEVDALLNVADDWAYQTHEGTFSLGDLIRNGLAEPISMGKFHELGPIAGLHELERNLMKPLDTDNAMVKNFYNTSVLENFAKISVGLDAEVKRLVTMVHPVFFYSRSWNVEQTQLIDLHEEHLRRIRKEYNRSLSQWVRDLADGYRLRAQALSKLRLLTQEWHVQFQKEGKIDPKKTIGGIHSQPLFTGCKSVLGSPEAWYRYGKFLAGSGQTVAGLINPFALAGKIVALPFVTIKSILQFKTLAGEAVAATKDSYFSMGYQYAIPGTEVKIEKNKFGETMGLVSKIFQEGCGDL